MAALTSKLAGELFCTSTSVSAVKDSRGAVRASGSVLGWPETRFWARFAEETALIWGPEEDPEVASAGAAPIGKVNAAITVTMVALALGFKRNLPGIADAPWSEDAKAPDQYVLPIRYQQTFLPPLSARVQERESGKCGIPRLPLVLSVTFCNECHKKLISVLQW